MTAILKLNHGNPVITGFMSEQCTTCPINLFSSTVDFEAWVLCCMIKGDELNRSLKAAAGRAIGLNDLRELVNMDQLPCKPILLNI